MATTFRTNGMEYALVTFFVIIGIVGLVGAQQGFQQGNTLMGVLRALGGLALIGLVAGYLFLTYR